MPPKKVKEEEVDVSKLPPWFAVNCALKCLGKKSRMQALLHAIKSQPKSFQKNISRDDIIDFAKEKGLYTDPNSLNEKQKKDPKFLETLNLEINASLIAKSFVALRADQDLKGRKAKKDKLEGKEEVDDKKVDPKKKDTKKDAKKGGKAVEVVVEEEKKEEVEPEKEYKKAIDAIYFLFDFPSAQDEVVALSTTEGQVDLCFEIREKVLWNNQEPDLDLLEPKENFDEDIRQRMDDFIDGEEDENGEGGAAKKPKREVLDEADLAYIEENKRFISEFKKTRAASGRDSSLRRTVVKELIFEVDPTSEEESLKAFIDYLIEEICAFSFDSLAYTEWTQGKKQVALCPKEALKLAQQHEEEEKLRKAAQELADQAALEEAENLKKKGGKKEAKKETKKDGKKDDPKAAAEEAAAAAAAAALKEAEDAKKAAENDQPPKLVKDPFYTYYRQLNEVKLEKTTAGILLECLLDEIESEKLQAVQQVHPQDRNELGHINSILNGLTDFVQFSQTNAVTPHAVVPNLGNNNLNTAFKDVIDECDEIEKRSHAARLANRDVISEREQAVFQRLLFPGIDRNLMPEVPEKSEALRKAEKSQLYPFISCNVHEFERRLTLTRFEEMMKEVEPERSWEFGERVLMERHNRNTLMQTLYKALLWEPSVVTKYNDKDDSLQVAMYYKNPPGRILRKKWNAEWKVFPNMENWINFFKNSEANIKNEIFYDIDYERIGNLHEKTKYMFPNDNSLIFGTKFQLADTTHYRYKVLKEGVTFGIKEHEKSPNFWALFDNNTQLFVELEAKKSANAGQANPEDEGHGHEGVAAAAAEEEAEKQAALTLTLVNGLVVKFLANGDVFQTKVEQDKRSLVRDFEDIVNPHELPKPNSEIEVKRIVTGKGSVIKYMKDGSIHVLYANGNVSFAQSKTANWITTNNKGLRKSRNAKDGSQTEYEAVACAKRTDPESGSKITIRADQTTIVSYRDGSVYTKHKDGTRMLSSPKKDHILVEHPDYSTVKVQLDEVKARTDTIIGLGSAYANVGFENLFDRSNNGVIVETYLPDGTKVVGYREKQELPGYNSYSTNQIHLVYLEDGSVAKVVDNGEVVLVSGVDRVALNDSGEKRELGQDIDYWLQLFCVSDERKAGVYTAQLSSGSLWTKDDEGNAFTLHSNGDIDSKIAVSLNLVNNNPMHNEGPVNPLDRPSTPDFNEGEFIEEENKFLPQPKTWVPVRLFTINNDNTGYELHSKEQVANYFRLKEEDKSCIRVIDEQVPNYQNCRSISFISSLLSLQEKKQEQIVASIPRNLDIIPKTEKKNEKPERQTFLYRNFLEFDVFSGEVREQHKADMEKYDLWKKEQTKQSNEFGIVQKSEEERSAEFNIQLRILESRKRQHREQTYDDAKQRLQEHFLPRADSIAFGTVKQINIEDLVQPEPAVEEEPVEDKQIRSNVRSHTQIQREKLQEKSKRARETQIESLKAQKRKDYFVSHYFDTIEGNDALNAMPKDIFNPVVMKTNAQDVNKKELDELKRKGQEIESDIRNSTIRSTRRGSNQDEQHMQQQQQLQDGSPIVQLEGEHQLGDSKFNTRQMQQRTIVIKPSVFTQRDIDDEKMIIEDEREALRFRKIKTKEYNVYGAERRSDQTKKVPCLARTNPLSELNQKYILTDSITDNRVKMSSMASRIHLNAPSISELRKAGTHQALAKTLDKKYNLEDLENKKNLMITADLNDQLRKDIQITPASARFGVLCSNRIYETKLIIKNEDVLAQRVVLKQPQTHYVKVFLSELGPIPMGLSREVIIRLNTSSDIIGKFHEEFQIMSKHQIYRIPIFANIVDQPEYDELEKETKELHNKPLLKTFVKEIEFNKRRGDQKSIGNDSQHSDLFPKLHGFDKNYKIDPTNNMNKQANQHDSFDQSFDN